MAVAVARRAHNAGGWSGCDGAQRAERTSHRRAGGGPAAMSGARAKRAGAPRRVAGAPAVAADGRPVGARGETRRPV